MSKKLFISIIYGFFVCHFVVAQNALVTRIESLLEEEFLQYSEVGIVIYDLDADEKLYSYQEKKLYRPASVQKVLTSVTALSLLGEKHSFETKLYYTGQIDKGTLHGDLYVVGGYDAEFAEEDMDRLTDLVLNLGITKIEGYLLGEVSMTDSVYFGKGWSWDDNPYGFQPYLSPLLYSKGYVEVVASPTAKDSLARIKVSPVSSFYSVDNQTKSKNPKAGKADITRDWLTNGNTIIVKGNITATKAEKINMCPSQDFFMHVFQEKLQQKGIEVEGYLYADLPENTEVTFIGSVSHTLADLLNPMMKKSDNLCAEAMFYHLAAYQGQQKKVGSQEGIEAIQKFMENSLGVMDVKKYRIADGSGLSPYNYVSPELILSFMKYAYSDKTIYNPLYLSLPVAGIDGSLQHRMKDGKAHKNVRAKTGTVTGVCSLAGYATAANGHTLIFVIINQNLLEYKRAREFQNKICEELCKWAGN